MATFSTQPTVCLQRASSSPTDAQRLQPTSGSPAHQRRRSRGSLQREDPARPRPPLREPLLELCRERRVARRPPLCIRLQRIGKVLGRGAKQRFHLVAHQRHIRFSRETRRDVLGLLRQGQTPYSDGIPKSSSSRWVSQNRSHSMSLRSLANARPWTAGPGLRSTQA